MIMKIISNFKPFLSDFSRNAVKIKFFILRYRADFLHCFLFFRFLYQNDAAPEKSGAVSVKKFIRK